MFLIQLKGAKLRKRKRERGRDFCGDISGQSDIAANAVSVSKCKCTLCKCQLVTCGSIIALLWLISLVNT